VQDYILFLTKEVMSTMQIINTLPSLFEQDSQIPATLLFHVIMDFDNTSVHKHVKKELGQHLAILISSLVNIQ